MHHAFLYISLLSLHDYDMKMPNCKFYEGCKQAIKSFFLFLNLSEVSKNSTPWKFAYIWHFQRIRINTTKFEETRIHFKSDVFGAVTVVGAKAPQAECEVVVNEIEVVYCSWDSLLYRIVSVFMMPEKIWWGWFEEKWRYMYLWCGFW